MPAGTDPTEELRERVEHQLGPAERLDYATWVGRAAERRGTGRARTAAATGGPGIDWRQRTRTGVLGGPAGSLADILDSVLPEPDTLAALALTDTRLLLLRERPPPARTSRREHGLRGMMDDFRRELTNLVGSQPQAPRPIAPLETVWQAPRESLVHTHAKWGSFADRVVLGFADASWVALIAPQARRLAAALAPR